jgi:predicted transcriptional regulator
LKTNKKLPVFKTDKEAEDFLVNDQQLSAAIEEGKKALRAGRVVDHATVVAAFERILNPRR